MRGYVASLLIVCGTLLAAAPVGSDFLQARELSRALSDREMAAGTTFIRQPLEESYQLGCWILGGAMIGLGIIGGSRKTPVTVANAEEYFFARAAG